MCFAQPSLDFLGHHLNLSGITPLQANVDAILAYPQPSTIKDLQRFLGLINFYRHFLPQAAAVLLPLTTALTGKPKSLTWTPAMSSSFSTAKQSLASATLLVHPHPHLLLALATGASDSHMGAVLQQRHHTHWQPLSSLLSFFLLSRGTPLLIENSWQHTLPSFTFLPIWRATHFSCTLTTAL